MNFNGYVYIGFKKMGELKRYGTTLETLRIQNYLASFEKEDSITNMYVETVTYRDKKKHLEYVKQLIHKIENEALVILKLEDFSTDEDDAESLYKLCWQKQVDLQIIESPWLNIGFLKQFDVSQNCAVEMLKVQFRYIRYKTEAISVAKKMLSEQPVIVNDHNKGMKLITKKSLHCKAIIVEQSMYFRGHLTDPEMIQELGIAKNTYYKYKKELREELNKIKTE